MSESRRSNLLLDAIAPELRAKIVGDSTLVRLQAGESIIKPGMPASTVWFPIDSVVSLVTDLESGGSVEAGLVGREGFAGIHVFLGRETTKIRGLVQASGAALSLPAAAFHHHLQDEGFRDVCGDYVDGLYTITSQSAACQAFHSVEQRLAKWLLAMQDRVSTRELPLTQEFLAAMLGVQRPTVTVAARLLHQAGMINYRHGKIYIIERAMLEDSACECYKAMINRLPLAQTNLQRC